MSMMPISFHKLERQMGTGGNASGSSPDDKEDDDDDDGHGDDDDNDDKPRLRPLQSVGLCSLSFPTQEPVSPRKCWYEI